MARVYEKKPMGERLSKYLEESKQKMSESKKRNR